MIKVSDYIVKRLAEYGVKHAFMISGGGSMHLNDSFGKSPDIEYLCNHHEQASAIAAEGYARASGNLAVVCVTSGPGGTNTLTGVIGQWLDSVPALYLSGQIRQATMRTKGLRQLGDQEINIVDIVRPVTKFAEVVKKPEDIGRLLEKAIYISMNVRPGPVWLDIPLDVQAAMIDENMLPHCKIDELLQCDPLPLNALVIKAASVADLLKSSSRPILIAGHGIRIAQAQELFLEVAEKLGIPVVTSFNGMDLIPSDHPLYVGRIGTIGTRSGNHALQNCDLLISIGSRNNLRQVSFDWDVFARNAKKVIVDIDAAELGKSTVKPDIAVHADAGDFLEAIKNYELKSKSEWGSWIFSCRSFSATRAAARVQGTSSAMGKGVDPYSFIETLTELLPEDAIIVSGNGTASVCLFQAGKVKKNTRIIMNSGCASMGYDLPAAIGACIANGKKEVICITGDGSVQMNIQELQTIAHHNLPIKIFVMNNNGYKSIQMTQDNYFEGRHAGADLASGVSCPDITRVAEAYRIQWGDTSMFGNLKDAVDTVMSIFGPVIFDVRLTPDYKFDKLNLSDF